LCTTDVGASAVGAAAAADFLFRREAMDILNRRRARLAMFGLSDCIGCQRWLAARRAS